MSLKSTAQDFSGTPFVIIEPEGINGHPHSQSIMGPEELLVGEPTEEFMVEEPHGEHESELTAHEQDNPLVEVVIEFDGDLPGSPHSPPPLEVSEEPMLEVVDEDEKKDKDNIDDNDAKKSKKSDRWDWEAKGAEGFLLWIKERFDTVPKHSGYDSAGLERAVSYLEKLDSEISKAMRLDLEEKLDANKIEDIRSKIEDGIDRLHERLDKVKKTKKNKRKKSSEVEQSALIKEAQKITGIQGIYIVAPLFASRIARICINGMVSAGHDIEYIYSKQVAKWKLTDREQAEVMQLLADMGYPLRQDRGYMPEDDMDVSSSDNFDWSAQHKA
jgi:hypothetical protein